MNKTFLLWDARSGELADQMRGHEDVTMAVAISPDSHRIASGSNDSPPVGIFTEESRFD